MADVEIVCHKSDPFTQKLIKYLDHLFDEGTYERDEATVGNFIQVTDKFNAKQLIKQAKPLLVHNKYKEAARVMESTAKEKHNIDHYLFLSSFKILANMAKPTDAIFSDMVKHLRGYKKIGKKEVVLEYLCTLFSDDYTRATEELNQFYVKKDFFNMKLQTPNRVIDPVLEGYMTFLEYIEWKKKVMDNEDSEYVSEGKIAAILKQFFEILQKPGRNDIFVIAVIEILEYYDRYSEIVDALEDYIQLNPENLNAYIYYFEYLLSVDANPQTQEALCTKITTLSPSDKRTLLLVLKIKDTDATKSLELLFSYLDYECNHNCEQGWPLFHEVLLNIFKHNAAYEAVIFERNWELRSCHWGHFHFHSSRIKEPTSEGQAQMLIVKAACANLLPFEEKSKFTEAARMTLSLNFKYKVEEFDQTTQDSLDVCLATNLKEAIGKHSSDTTERRESKKRKKKDKKEKKKKKKNEPTFNF